METFKALTLAGCASMLLFGAAQAADLEASPPGGFDWSGFYAGATAGYVWGEADFELRTRDGWTSFPVEASTYENAMDMDLSPQGFIGGAKLGWNSQSDSFVFGFEGDFSYADADDGESVGAQPQSTFASGRNDAELSWLSTLRLRAGIAFDRALIYATGGLAAGKWDVASVIESQEPDSTVRFRDDDWKLGWVVGGGIEYALSESWSFNAEYLFMDFGKVDGDTTFPPPALPDLTQNHEVDLTAQIVRAGLSFHFQ